MHTMYTNAFVDPCIRSASSLHVIGPHAIVTFGWANWQTGDRMGGRHIGTSRRCPVTWGPSAGITLLTIAEARGCGGPTPLPGRGVNSDQSLQWPPTMPTAAGGTVSGRPAWCQRGVWPASPHSPLPITLQHTVSRLNTSRYVQ